MSLGLHVAKLFAVIALVASTTLVPGSGANAEPTPPGPDAGCASTVLSMKKSDGYIVSKMRLNCSKKWAFMRVYPAMQRSGGGKTDASFYSGGKECSGAISVCTMTWKVKDVGGKNEYTLFNLPGGQGTIVGNGASAGGHVCHDKYLSCDRIIREF